MPQNVRVSWFGEMWLAQFKREQAKNVTAACVYLRDRIKEDISQPGTLRYQAAAKKGGKGRTKTVYNFTHSKPGNPPYKQSGQLRRSIQYEVIVRPFSIVGRVGTKQKSKTGAPYPRYLELGTKRMAARPYLRPALAKHQTTLRSILLRQVAAGGLPASRSNQFRSGVAGKGMTGKVMAEAFGL